MDLTEKKTFDSLDNLWYPFYYSHATSSELCSFWALYYTSFVRGISGGGGVETKTGFCSSTNKLII